MIYKKEDTASKNTNIVCDFCQIVASELNDPICHSDECQIGSFSSEATKCDHTREVWLGDNIL